MDDRRTRQERNMKRKLMVAAIAATLFSAAAWAQWGPGMMGGGYGPGMMGGGYGPGMMGGFDADGGMGPGMMGGYGPGMMGRNGGYGPGMMGGYGSRRYEALDLTDAQRDKIAEIQKDAWGKRWSLMSAMHELGWKSYGPDAKNDVDPEKTYEAMAALRKQMFEANLEAGKKIEGVLTTEQKEQLRKERRRGW
jgi:Spy/CpxP family protein refolding chaperone